MGVMMALVERPSAFVDTSRTERDPKERDNRLIFRLDRIVQRIWRFVPTIRRQPGIPWDRFED